MIYLEIIFKEKKEKQKKTLFEKMILFLLPNANPDFDNKIPDINHWFLEFKDSESPPIREIGLDSNLKTVMKMPYKSNYGFWTDNSLILNDFKTSFDFSIIKDVDFEKKWNELN